MLDRTTLRPILALATTLALAITLASTVVATQAESTAAPSPSPQEGLQAARDEWRAARDEWQTGKDEWNARKDEWKADRKAARAAWRAARDEWKAQRRARHGGAANDERSAIDGIYTEAAADETGVVRTDLGIAHPASASGEDLGLWHYAIPAGQELAPHTHPGWQLARVTAGELEYSVISGEGELLRADGTSQPMGPGTYVLATGDGVIENPDLVHYGANRTDHVVTILSATLFPAGAPVATLVDEPADEASPANASPAA